jgi:hypothetical protein
MRKLKEGTAFEGTALGLCLGIVGLLLVIVVAQHRRLDKIAPGTSNGVN